MRALRAVKIPHSHIMNATAKIFVIVSLLFETGSHYVAQDGLEFKILLPQSLRAGIIGMYHHAWLEPGL
jgi:hypothetical protein